MYDAAITFFSTRWTDVNQACSSLFSISWSSRNAE